MDPETGIQDPYDARMADAPAEPARGAPSEPAEAERATLLLFADADRLVEGAGITTIAQGPAISNDVQRRLACDARIKLAPIHAAEVIRLGRSMRSVPAGLALVLKARNVTCRFPGCGRTRHLSAHHLRHWADGGATDADNLVSLCHFHHRLMHEGRRHTRVDRSHDLVFIRPDARELSSRPMRLRPDIRRGLFGDRE